MSNFSKEFIVETKKEIQRLEGLVRNYESRIESLQELLRDDSGVEGAPRAGSRKKAIRPNDNGAEQAEPELENVVSA